MEVFYYRCPVCGYTHQVPSYWMSFAAEDTHEQMHFSPADRSLCSNQTLEYAGEGETD